MAIEAVEIHEGAPDVRRRWPSAVRWREAAAAGMGVVVICLLPLAVNDRFYFNDDYQSYFMPVFREIARLIMAGEFPLSTPRIWFGGAIAGEYQYAVFHPVCLALYLILSGVDNLVVAATLYSLTHIFLLAAGLYALCRHLDCAPLPAFTGALIGTTSSWLLYWGAANWIPALVSEAWAVWALLFLLLAARSARYAAAAAVAVAFTLLAGWPFTSLALLVAIIALAALACAARAEPAGVWRAALALALGALLAMPALLTTAAYLAESSREPAAPPLWILTLNGLLSVGVPSAVEVWKVQEGVWYPNSKVQMLYASWLIPVALAVGGWGQLWRTRRRTLLAVLTLAALFALGSMLPVIGQFRWFIRLLPFYHVALAVLTALLLNHAAAADGRWRRRYPLALLLVFLPFLIPTALGSHTYVLSMLFGPAILVALAVALEFGRRNIALFRVLLIAGHALILAMVIVVWPRNIVVPVWDYPAAGPSASVDLERPVRRLALYDSAFGLEPGRAYWSLIALGNTAAFLNAETINGYSPLVQRGIARLFCFNFKGGICAEDAPERLFRRRFYSLNLLDLAGIGEVATDSAGHAARFSALAGDDWRIALRDGPYTVFRRAQPPADTLAAVVPEGLTVMETDRSARRAVFELRPASDFPGGELVLRRPWYPGVYARLNGRALDVRTLEGALPVVTLPPGARGRLVVGYWPKGLDVGLILSVLAVIMLVLLGLRPRLFGTPIFFVALWRSLVTLCARWSGGSSPA